MATTIACISSRADAARKTGTLENKCGRRSRLSGFAIQRGPKRCPVERYAEAFAVEPRRQGRAQIHHAGDRKHERISSIPAAVLAKLEWPVNGI
jgi:hypothetical protein